MLLRTISFLCDQCTYTCFSGDSLYVGYFARYLSCAISAPIHAFLEFLYVYATSHDIFPVRSVHLYMLFWRFFICRLLRTISFLCDQCIKTVHSFLDFFVCGLLRTMFFKLFVLCDLCTYTCFSGVSVNESYFAQCLFVRIVVVLLAFSHLRSNDRRWEKNECRCTDKYESSNRTLQS